jgi:hypothetical protein
MQQLGPINRDDTCKLVLEGKGEEKKKKRDCIIKLSKLKTTCDYGYEVGAVNF